MEELAIGSRADLVNRLPVSQQLAILAVCGGTYGGIKVDEDGSRHVFAAAGLGEESLVGASLTDVTRIRVGTSVGLQAMLEQVSGVPSSVQRRVKRAIEHIRTAPRRCYPAGYQPGRYGGGRSTGSALAYRVPKETLAGIERV